jgi:hypothetical protein
MYLICSSCTTDTTNKSEYRYIDYMNVKPEMGKADDSQEISLEEINRRILADNCSNLKGSTNIKWWIDYSVLGWEMSDLSQDCAILGIPFEESTVDSQPIQSIMSTLAHFEPTKNRTNVSLVDLKCGYKNGVAAVHSTFLDCLCLRNIPMVHRDPAFLRRCNIPILNDAATYLSRKTAFFIPTIGKRTCTELNKSAMYAQERIASLLDDDRNNRESSTFGKTKSLNDPRINMPDRNFDMNSRDDLFLLSISDMKNYVPFLQRQAFSLHIQSHGSSPIMLFTVRKLKRSGANKNYTLEQQSRDDPLGRIVIGVWRKLLEVNCFMMPL